MKIRIHQPEAYEDNLLGSSFREISFGMFSAIKYGMQVFVHFLISRLIPVYMADLEPVLWLGYSDLWLLLFWD